MTSEFAFRDFEAAVDWLEFKVFLSLFTILHHKCAVSKTFVIELRTRTCHAEK